MSILLEVFVPKESVNDDTVVITYIFFSQWDKVEKGNSILICEHTKAAIEIDAPCDGYIELLCSLEQEIPIGAPLFRIHDAPGGCSERQNIAQSDPSLQRTETLFSKKALDLMKQYNLRKATFANFTSVSAKDVAEYIDGVREKSGKESRCSGRLPIVLHGSGAHSRVLVDLIKRIPFFSVYGYIDDNRNIGEMISGFPVLGHASDAQRISSQGVLYGALACGLLDTDAKERIKKYRQLTDNGFMMLPLVHPTATIESGVHLSPGVQVLAGAYVGTNSVLGEGSVINTNAVISHDCVIDDFTHVAPGAIIAGHVVVGKGCIIGAGCTIYIKTNIGDGSIVYNGANVMHAIPKNSIYKK